jgi:glycolate dehydrogenase FAD-linked subunit
MPIAADLLPELAAIVGAQQVRADDDARVQYGMDALKRGHPADIVVFPKSTLEVAAVVRVCARHRVPIVPRGGGSGYTGGSVPIRGGVVVSTRPTSSPSSSQMS